MFFLWHYVKYFTELHSLAGPHASAHIYLGRREALKKCAMADLWQTRFVFISFSFRSSIIKSSEVCLKALNGVKSDQYLYLKSDSIWLHL